MDFLKGKKHFNNSRLHLTNYLSQHAKSWSLIRSLRSFTYLKFFSEGQDPRTETQVQNRKAEHVLSLFHTNVGGREAANCARLHRSNKQRAREVSGWAGGRSVGGVGQSATAAETRGQAHRKKNWAGVGSAGRLFRLSFPEWKQSLRVNG